VGRCAFEIEFADFVRTLAPFIERSASYIFQNDIQTRDYTYRLLSTCAVVLEVIRYQCIGGVNAIRCWDNKYSEQREGRKWVKQKRKETGDDVGVDHLRATRLRSRPSSNSTSIGSLDGKTTGGTPALFEAFMLLVLLVRRLEDGV